MTKIQNLMRRPFWTLLILDFGLVSNFVLRIWNFVARKNCEQDLRFWMDNG
jgi:hypothetical protein